MQSNSLDGVFKVQKIIGLQLIHGVKTGDRKDSSKLRKDSVE